MTAPDVLMEKHFIGNDRCAQVMNQQHDFIGVKNANTTGDRMSD